MTNSDLLGMLGTIGRTDDRYPGSMKLAAIIDRLTAMCPSAEPFDPDTLYNQINVLDERLPGSRKLAALVYLMVQIANAPHFLDGGMAQMPGGQSLVVNTIYASASNPVLLSCRTDSGDVTVYGYGTIVEGVSFTIYSQNPFDTGLVAWAIVQG